MQITIEIPNFIKDDGISLEWDYGFAIDAQQFPSGVAIKANKAGLISLARHLLTLSQDSVPKGHHIHFDDSNSLEDNSCELLIEKS